MEKRMKRALMYNGTITAEQFLFYEIRIASKYYLDGTSVEDAIEKIKKNNLFQYPTERLVARMVRSCYKRLPRRRVGVLSSWGSFLKSRQGVSLLLPACDGRGGVSSVSLAADSSFCGRSQEGGSVRGSTAHFDVEPLYPFGFMGGFWMGVQRLGRLP